MGLEEKLAQEAQIRKDIILLRDVTDSHLNLTKICQHEDLFEAYGKRC